jgi:hypothetical protein
LRRTVRIVLAGCLAFVLWCDAVRAQVVVTVNDTVNFRLGFLLQTWTDELQDPISRGYSSNFFLRRVRLIAAGNLARDVSFFFETENSRLGNVGADGVKNIDAGFHVLDAFGEWRMFGNDQLILDVGKVVIPLTRNTLQSITSPLALDAGTFTFLQSAGTQSDAGRDLGFQLKSYLANGHLELRGGVFDGVRAASSAGGAGARNSPRWVGRVVYNFFDTESGYVPVGTNLGKKRILAFGGGYDTQGTYKAYGGDFMIDWPIGPTEPVQGQNAMTAHVDYIRFDGGCSLTAAGTRATNCLIPTLTDQEEIFTDLGFYFVDLKLQPFLRFEWNGFVDDIDHRKDSRRYMGGFNYYVAQQNLKITGAYERIVPNVEGATMWKQKNTNHLVVQLQFLYF